MTDASSLWQQFQPQRHQYQMPGSPFLFPVSVCLYIYMCVCVCVCVCVYAAPFLFPVRAPGYILWTKQSILLSWFDRPHDLCVPLCVLVADNADVTRVTSGAAAIAARPAITPIVIISTSTSAEPAAAAAAAAAAAPCACGQWPCRERVHAGARGPAEGVHRRRGTTRVPGGKAAQPSLCCVRSF